MTNKEIRIKDIATLAGVSAGTVDRVLHSRGDVSEASREKVERVLSELNFRPNQYASALASRRHSRRFAYLIPILEEGGYWMQIDQGIRRATEELSSINLTITPYYFNQFDASDFYKQTQRLLEESWNGVIFAPVFEEESRRFAEELRIRSIETAMVDSRIDTPEETLFYGQDSHQSGRLACRLMQFAVAQGSEVLLFHSRRSDSRWSTQSAARRKGFIHYADEYMLDYRIRCVELTMEEEPEAMLQIEAAFRAYPNATGAILFNSRSYLIAEVLQRIGRKQMVVIGFDTIERNINALRSRHIHFLIGQRPELQGYRIVKSLADSTILNQPIRRINYMPLDVLTDNNIDYYLDFTY